MALDLFSLMVLAIGLAMDAFAVAISLGASIAHLRVKQLVRLALAFGGFQGLMPIVGYLAGRSLREHPWVAEWDHWMAFGLLASMGVKMLYESRFLPDDGEEASLSRDDPTKSVSLLILALATSIDALAVGASLAFIRVTILVPSLVIGGTAAIFSVVGAYVGQHAGKRFGKKMEILGGLALIAIGLRILIDHLLHPLETGQVVTWVVPW